MNQDIPSTGFEQRLLTQLRTAVAECGVEAEAATGPSVTPGWRRGPRLAFGGAFAAAAVATALVVSAGGGGTPAAFAVEPQEGGGVNIEIHSLGDPGGLEDALEEAGIPADVTYLPTLTACREPRFEGSTLAVPSADGDPLLGAFTLAGPEGPMTIGIGDEQQRHELLEGLGKGEVPTDSVPNLFLNPDWFAPDQTLVLTGAPDPYLGDPSGNNPTGQVTSVAVAKGPIAPCDPVPLGH